MKSIYDLITEKEKELDIQGITAKPMKIDEADWLKCKEYINKLSVDYRSIVTNALEKNTWRTYAFIYNKNNIVYLEKIFSPRVEIRLEIVEDANKAIRRIIYYGFNNKTGESYIRSIL